MYIHYLKGMAINLNISFLVGGEEGGSQEIKIIL